MTIFPPSRPAGGAGEERRGDFTSVFIDPWLTCQGDALKALTDTIMSRLSAAAPRAPVTRAARRDALARKELAVANLVANLAALALSPHAAPSTRLGVSTAKTKATRYDRADYPRRILAETLAALETIGVLKRYPYLYKQLATTVEPTEAFKADLESHGVRLRDIGRERGGEAIWLNARTGEAPFGNNPMPKALMPYDDTEETNRLRSEVQRLNAFLNASAMTFDGEPQVPVALRRTFLLRSPQDTPAFNLNGRLVGGWWQNLKSTERHRIAIDGEAICDIDFASCFAMLAYLRVTGGIPNSDAYDIPGLEEHRQGAKLGLLSLLSRSTEMRRLAPELKAALPHGWNAQRLHEAMARRHPAIAGCFGTDIGVELMADESRLLMAVLLELEAREIPTQSLHDGLQVRISDREEAMEVMQAVSARELGQALPVREKAVRRPTIGAA
ncbi:hypothetical protein [Ancylobacter polymorphus]|uniref:Uncharacterized protein n=1 Tax=Ancylobacter polymorphus TaxID=223390 RepID=A0A9E6ZWK2_9HYPH|nr:hypothetical protein [Ancylobacter polymorphus]UOK71457.1 hypothetical protein K9D25_01615 [Ancylobacter polymorphus]